MDSIQIDQLKKMIYSQLDELNDETTLQVLREVSAVYSSKSTKDSEDELTESFNNEDVKQKIYSLLTKEQVIRSLQTLPEKFNAEEAIEKILFLARIHVGLQQSQSGNTLSEKQVRERLSKWLK